MRKVLSVAILIGIVLSAGAIVFLLVGDRNREDLVATEQETTPVPLTVATSTISEETPDYQIDAEYPRFGIPAIDARIQSWIVSGVGELKAVALQDEPAKNDFAQYSYASTFSSVYTDDQYISAMLSTGTYTGGAHGMPVIIGINFKRWNEQELSLDDALLMTGLSLDEIATQAKAQLVKQFGEVVWQSGADPEPVNYDTFYLTKKHVVFVFQPYQVASYAAGAPEVAIPRK